MDWREGMKGNGYTFSTTREVHFDGLVHVFCQIEDVLFLGALGGLGRVCVGIVAASAASSSTTVASMAAPSFAITATTTASS